jgi:hypothetical protein
LYFGKGFKLKMGKISYREMMKCKRLTAFGAVDANAITNYDTNNNAWQFEENERLKNITHHSHSQTAKQIGLDGGQNMATEVNWDSALAGSGKYVKLEEGKRIVLVGKNPRFDTVMKEFKGQQEKSYAQLTLDIVEEGNVECEKELNTISKRFIAGLRKVFEGIEPEVEVRFSVKKIGEGTDTNYDVELVE